MKRLLSIISLIMISISLFADEFVVDGIKYQTTSSNTVEVISNSYSGDMVIPDNVENNGIIYSVTSIGEWAFNQCSGLTSVTIPNSVTSIGHYAFSGCTGLTSVHLPNSVTTIGYGAFKGCTGLTSVTIPNSVTSIGEGAFEECSNLGSVIIHDIATWCNISFGDNRSNPLYYAHHLYLGDEEIKHLIIPNTVTSISDLAFKDCTGITSVTIPNSVTNNFQYFGVFNNRA